MKEFRVLAYFGKEYTKDKIEKDLNELAEQRFIPTHIDTQEAYAIIVLERDK